MKWILVLFPLFTLSFGKDPPFPDFSKMFMGSYQFKSELVTRDSNVVYVDEHFDMDQQVGRLDITIDNGKESIFYDAEFKNCTRVRYADNHCFEEKLADYSVFKYDNFVIPAFRYDKDKYVLGPSAVFYMAESKKIKYEGKEIVRGIDTDVFTFNSGSIYIYFTRDTWTDAFTGKKGSFPVRITIDGSLELDSGVDEYVHQTFDITLLVPYVKDFTVFQVPAGIGCQFKKEDIDTPVLPESFSFVAEIYNVTNGERSLESTVDIFKIWYAENLGICRLETFIKGFFGAYQILDYNKGILYNFDQHGICRILSSYDSIFTEHSGKITPRLKTPRELFKLNIGKPYYVGKARSRGIMCDAWEAMALDFETQDTKTNSKIVHTFYFSAENWVDNMPGSTKDRIPVHMTTSYYSLTNKKKPSYKLDSKIDASFFNFKEDFSEDLDKFNVEDCYPADKERQYLEIQFRPDDTTELLAELNNFQVKNILLLAFTMQFNITSLRIPLIDIAYEPNLIKAKLILLEAPNILDSFHSMSESLGLYIVPDKDSILLEGTYPTPTECATLCLGKKTCTQFYYCEEKQYCYLKESNELSTSDAKDDFGCEWYTKSDAEVTAPEPLLKDLIQQLTTKVNDGKFILPIFVNGKEVPLTATNVKLLDKFR